MIKTLDLNSLATAPIEGSFHRFETPALLLRMARERHSGCLTLLDGDRVRTVTFADGIPTSAGSQVPSERLGQRLLKLDLLSQEQLAKVDAVMCAKPVQFGEALLQLGFMQEAELRRTLRTHHNWILAQSLAAAKLETSFSAYGWVAPDPSGLALMQAIEDGVRAYGQATTRALLAHTSTWSFCSSADEVLLLQRLGAPKAMVDMLLHLQDTSCTLAQLVATCPVDDGEIMGLALILSGALRALPNEHSMIAQVDLPSDEAASANVTFAPLEVGGPTLTEPPRPRGGSLWLADIKRALGPGPFYLASAAVLASLTVIIAIAVGSPADDAAPPPEATAPASATATPAAKADDLRERPSTAVLREAEGEEPAEITPPTRPETTSAPAKAARRTAPVKAAAPDKKRELITEHLQSCARAFQRGEYVESVKACRRVLDLDPAHPLAYRYLGIAYAKLGVRKEACESYRRYLRYGDNPPDRQQVEALLRACD